MKAEYLKNLQIKRSWQAADCTHMIPPNSQNPAVVLWHHETDTRDFDSEPESLRVAALFRASHKMQEALREAAEIIEKHLLQNFEEPNRIAEDCLLEIRAALALSETTNETPSCDKACSPSDWSAEGKCGQNQCYQP